MMPIKPCLLFIALQTGTVKGDDRNVRACLRDVASWARAWAWASSCGQPLLVVRLSLIGRLRYRTSPHLHGHRDEQE